MRNGLWANALAAALGLLTLGLAGAQQQAGQTPPVQTVAVVGTRAISNWTRAESQHFLVYSDAPEEDVTQLLDNLEKLDQLLRIYTGHVGESAQAEPKLSLYYSRQVSDLGQVGGDPPTDAVALYSSCAAGVRGVGLQIERIPALADAQLDKAPLNDSLSYAFEAYARHFLYRHTDIRTPKSFIDGFAQYFSSVRFSEKQMVVGRVPKSLGEYLEFLGEGRMYSLEYTEVLENHDANAHNYGGPAGVHLEFEARSWLLMHYMMSSSDKRKRMNRYLALVDLGQSPTAAFERAFGLKASDIDVVMWRYRLRGMQVLRVEPPALPTLQVRFHALPQTAGEFVLADAALKSCPTPQAGEALLKKVSRIAGRFPNDNFGRLTLSRAQIDWGRAEEALPLLDAVLQQEDTNFEARYLLGLANLRLAEQSQGDARRAYLQSAQGHLRRALELNPQSPEAALAAFKAEMAATDEPGEAALAAVISASHASRDFNSLARFAALAYSYEGKAPEAKRVLAWLAQDERDRPMAQWATQWQGRLDAGATHDDIRVEMHRDVSPDALFKEWTIDLESVMQRVKLKYDMANAAQFIKQAPGGKPDAPTTGQSDGKGQR